MISFKESCKLDLGDGFIGNGIISIEEGSNSFISVNYNYNPEKDPNANNVKITTCPESKTTIKVVSFGPNNPYGRQWDGVEQILVDLNYPYKGKATLSPQPSDDIISYGEIYARKTTLVKVDLEEAAR